jgi:hypothetical protein
MVSRMPVVERTHGRVAIVDQFRESGQRILQFGELKTVYCILILIFWSKFHGIVFTIHEDYNDQLFTS